VIEGTDQDGSACIVAMPSACFVSDQMLTVQMAAGVLGGNKNQMQTF